MFSSTEMYSNCTAPATMIETVTSGVIMSALSSSAFFFAAIVIFIVVKCCARRNYETIFDPKEGQFGSFMLIVEFVDAIPEAGILGDAATRTCWWDHSLALVVSIFFFNLVNVTATIVDLIAQRTKSMHRFLYILIFYALGMLVYSIPADIYADFEEKWNSNHRGMNSLLLLFAGTIVGTAFIMLLIKLHYIQCGKHPNTGNKGKYFKTLVIAIVLPLWTILLTTSFAFIFGSIDNKDHYLASFLEGLSGGAFLATMAGTIIPKAAEEAEYIESEQWRRILGLAPFITGLLVSCMIDIAF